MKTIKMSKRSCGFCFLGCSSERTHCDPNIKICTIVTPNLAWWPSPLQTLINITIWKQAEQPLLNFFDVYAEIISCTSLYCTKCRETHWIWHQSVTDVSRQTTTDSHSHLHTVYHKQLRASTCMFLDCGNPLGHVQQML